MIHDKLFGFPANSEITLSGYLKIYLMDKQDRLGYRCFMFRVYWEDD